MEINMKLPSDRTIKKHNYNPACQTSNVFPETTQNFFECKIERRGTLCPGSQDINTHMSQGNTSADTLAGMQND